MLFALNIDLQVNTVVFAIYFFEFKEKIGNFSLLVQ